MSQLLASGVNDSFVVIIVASAILYGTPLLFAALGELLAERSGVLNLGVEGMMLVGAVAGFWAVQNLDAVGGVSLTGAIAIAALAGAAMALIHAFLVITLRANQIVSGLALTIFAGALGLSVVPRQRSEPQRAPGGSRLHGARRCRPRRRSRARADRASTSRRSSTCRGPVSSGSAST